MAGPTEETPLCTGEQRRPSVLQCMLAKASNGQESNYAPSLDALDHEREPSHRQSRNSIFSQEVEEALQSQHPETYAALTGSFLGYLFQGVCLVATVFAYVGGPVLVNYAKTVGHTEDGKPIKSENVFLEAMVVLMTKASCILVSAIGALLIDLFSGRGMQNLTRLFSPQELLAWNLLALGWTIADTSEIMANGRIDAATYTVLSQTRLMGTALVMRMAAGAKRSTLQWSILLALSLVIIGWKMMPDQFYAPPSGSGKEAAVVGYVFTALKMALSILCGVFGQKLLQQNAEVPFVVQEGQICVVSMVWSGLSMIPILYWILPSMGKPWHYSPLGGEPTDDGEGFFSYRPWMCVAFYVYREYCTNFCVKQFDALVKNLCNAVAAVLSYYINCFVLGETPFNAVKGIFTVVIGMEILHYSWAQALPAVPADGQKK